MKIHIIGAAGAGKTTLAQRLSATLHIPLVELDALHWKAGWTKTPAHVFQAKIDQVVHAPAWLVDGSYESVRKLVWDRADIVVWLDYPAPLHVWRLMRRGVRYIVDKTNLWGSDNHESLRWLLGRESIIVRSLKAHSRMKVAYPQEIEHERYRRIKFVHLQSEGATNRWLLSI